MRAAIHNPYLDTLGGGERYTLSFAKVLTDMNYAIDIEFKDKDILKKAKERFGIELINARVVDDIKAGDNYEVCFWLSDGSIPLLKARKNYIHFQIPFNNVNGSTLLNRMKFFRVNKIICNSLFTKKFIDREYSVKSLVIYPPVDTSRFKPKKKENIILSVGRFSRLTQEKGQDTLISVFKTMVDSGLSDWRLVLAGGTEVGADSFFEELVNSIGNYPIEIIKSPLYKSLVELYGHAKIYWTASGFGVVEEIHPEKVEHFGISLVEALSSGCASLAYSAGGHKEIIQNNKNGLLWRSKSELMNKTLSIINDNSFFREISSNAKKSVNNFSYFSFEKNVQKIL